MSSAVVCCAVASDGGLISKLTTTTTTQVRRVMNHAYGSDFYAGDEDNGEQGSWFVLSALGLYATAPVRESPLHSWCLVPCLAPCASFFF